MKKIISSLLCVVIMLSVCFAVPTAQAATKTTFNGKTATVGSYVKYRVYLKTPETLENFQGYVSYTSGLKYASASLSETVEKGGYVANHVLDQKKYRFNGSNISKGYDFRSKKLFVVVKFKVIKSGAQKASFRMEIMQGLKTEKDYGQNDGKYYNKCSVYKYNNVLATSVKLSKTKLTLKRGKTYTLKYSLTPSSASRSVQWSSNNKKVATVTTKGKITAKKKGICYITCKAKDGSGKYKKCKVTVK